MPKLQTGGSTPQQMAYATKLLSGAGVSKAQMARDAGYSSYVSKSVATKIEAHKGFHNAVIKLASQSNNLALKIMHEFEIRDMKDFSNKELTNALSAIGQAWQRFNGAYLNSKEKNSDDSKNKLRTVILQRVENQTINSAPPEVIPEAPADNVVEEVIEEPISVPTEDDTADDF